ncbi:MAG: cation-translocating P-type ATPase [Eubacterium sp.]|nr:cation-translocating P-type ATPase [Eubacterium sp.]
MSETSEAKEKHYYGRSVSETLDEFNSSKSGLSDETVRENREKFGENKLFEKKKESILQIFLNQFKDLLVVILIISALISMATGNNDSAIVIFAVLIMNAILGTVQYVKAQKSLDSLKKLSSPEAKVIRSTEQQVIDARDLVCGDIIVLDAGDIVPGDARITESHTLKLNESSLTGESESAEKSADTLPANEGIALGDQKDMVFSGSLVTYGRARAVVTGVGRHTELGRIAGLMNEAEERKTPLQVTMDNFSKKLSVAIIAVCIVVFGLSMYRGMSLPDAMLFAVALAVAAIPEALSSIITISLAIGTSRMADQNAIIKDLSAVEGLGCVSVICSDKTGTLTQNRMTVEHVSVFGDEADGRASMLSLASILCNDTAIVDGETVGDPTETAFIDFYMKNHDDYFNVMDEHPRLSEVPFDSDRKLMSTLHQINGEYVMFTKGAIDVILSRAKGLTEEQKEAIQKENFDLSNSGLRVLGFAMKHMRSGMQAAAEDNAGSQSSVQAEAADRADSQSGVQAAAAGSASSGKTGREGFDGKIDFDDEYDLEYIGLMAEMDPPRTESAQAVADCRAAGIRPVMITGDHKITASAIARRIGIMQEGDLAFTGPEIDAMTDDELDDKLKHISVYARVSPDNKIRIVKAWQRNNDIVAMTGDGVNDGPALKNSDVGVAMGITGTEVAKDSASMILTDDNFATIIKAVLNGRNIYANIKNAIIYLLSGNFAGIIAVLFCSLMGLPMPFTAVQLLFINLITDSLPALAISMEPSNPDLINEKPRSRTESILDKPAVTTIGLTGALIAVVTLIAFYIGLGSFPQIAVAAPGAVTASTMAFATLCLARLWHGFNCRGRENIFRLGLFRNIYTIGAFVVGALLLTAIITLPFFTKAFGVQSIEPTLIGIVWALAFIPTLIIQIVKAVRK